MNSLDLKATPTASSGMGWWKDGAACARPSELTDYQSLLLTRLLDTIQAIAAWKSPGCECEIAQELRFKTAGLRVPLGPSTSLARWIWSGARKCFGLVDWTVETEAGNAHATGLQEILDYKTMALLFFTFKVLIFSKCWVQLLKCPNLSFHVGLCWTWMMLIS